MLCSAECGFEKQGDNFSKKLLCLLVEMQKVIHN